ncbi:MAG TPA: hypothetical protein VGF28_13060 [Thermoanaerobaculia bacterium]|jgi:hypothetical protein
MRVTAYALAALLSGAAVAEQATVRLVPPSTPGPCVAGLGGASCSYGSAEDPMKLVHVFVQTNNNPACLSFADPLPAGSTVTSLDLRISYMPKLSNDTGSAQANVYLWGPETTPRTMQDYLIGGFTADTGELELRCEPPYDQLSLATVTGAVNAKGVRGYVYGGRNGLYVNTPEWGTVVEFVDVTLNFKRPPVVEFELSASTDEKQRRILINRWREDSAYFSSAQATLPEIAGRNARIRIAGTARDADGPVANRTLYLRVIDPPDTAPYVPVPARRRGDNANGRGSLRETTVTTDAGGRFETVLNATRFASGDNYQIEASTVANFGGKETCGADNNCFSSGVLTAWKRVHLEVGRMFRRGSYLAETTTEGTDRIKVRDVAPFTPGGRIMLIHAPLGVRQLPASPAEYWSVERTIRQGGVKRSQEGPGGVLELDQPVHDVFVASPPDVARWDSVTTDFVGLVTGNPGDDYYEPNVVYLEKLFADAFVDYVLMEPAALPLVTAMQEDVAALLPKDETREFAERWNRHMGWLGHQYLFGVRTTTSATANRPSRGVTRIFNGHSYSHVMVQTILGQFASAASRRLLGEVGAHEVAHQWHTNPWSSRTANGSHCADSRYYDNPLKKCLMHWTYGPAGGAFPEFTDDIVRFHYVVTASGVDSEYRWIRERCDPVLKFSFTSPLDWWTVPVPPCR